MAHYARVNGLTKLVEKVIVADEDFINNLPDKDFWIQTSYNTSGNQHSGGGTPLRGNYAGIGYTWDEDNEIFWT